MQQQPEIRKNALTFILISVLLDMMALGVIVPVLTPLIKSFTHTDVSATEWIGIFSTIFALMQFIFSPLLGVLSDRFGRRAVILLSNLGLGLDYVIMAIAPSVGWLLIGRVISGVSSSNISVVYAYITDVTPPEKRAAGFGMIGAAFGVGFVLGPAVGGLLSQHGDLRLPFWVSAGLSFLNFLYGLLVLPESLPENLRNRFEFKRANPLAALKLLRSHGELFGISIAYFLAMVAHDALPTIWAIYGIARYHWDPKTIGLSVAVVGLSQIVVSAKLVGPAVKWLGDRYAMVVGFGFGSIAYIVWGTATTSSYFFAGIPILALWAIATPGLQAIAARHVTASEQGELQGALGSIRGIATIVGSSLFPITFYLFIGTFASLHFFGAPWYLGALLLLGTCAIGWYATRGEPELHAVLQTQPSLEEVEF